MLLKNIKKRDQLPWQLICNVFTFLSPVSDNKQNLTHNCTGEVRLYINNDDPLKLNLTDGKANFTVKFKRGVNYIYIYYYGDEYYSFSTWNRTFTIDATPVLTLETQDLRSDSTGYIRIKCCLYFINYRGFFHRFWIIFIAESNF
jgi:hypothetical protein